MHNPVNKQFVLLVVSVLLLWPSLVHAQTCDCSNCGQIIPINSTTVVDFEVAGATNDDLSNAGQGVCGVVVEFRHDFIWSVEMVLTSPSGQQVQLVGPRVTPPLGSFTGFAYWDVVFLPAAVAVSPDVGFNVTWDNDQNWQTAGRYNGSYYPSSGSLEEFNGGSVNGTWRLAIANTSTFYTGFIDNFKVIFCDDSGLDCQRCEADAGDLSATPNVESCAGSPDLSFTMSPQYNPGPGPDPAEYEYAYIVARLDSILAFQTQPDLTTFPSGIYTVCGFSYLASDAARLPSTSGNNLQTTLESNLSDPLNPFICGDISDFCIVVTITEGDATNVSADICAGETFPFDGQLLTQSGMYQDTIQTSDGCDSIVFLSLEVRDTSRVRLNEQICAGESYLFDGAALSQSGIYLDTLQNSNSCESIIELALTV